MTRAADLPPSLRKAIKKGQVRASKETLAAVIPDRPRACARGQLEAPWRYRCHTCKAEFVHWATVQRHVDGHGHGRIEEFNPHDPTMKGAPK